MLKCAFSLMGPTGAGKSTFINYATRQDGSSIGHSLQSQTSEIRAVRCLHPVDKGPIIFVDTPGFDDTYKSDIEILSLIAGWFVAVYKEHIPLAAIVYLHRISDKRMAGSPLKNLTLFASLCGQAVMPYVVLGTTMWSEVPHAVAKKRDMELQNYFWKDMLAQGCKVQPFSDSYKGAWKMIGTLPTTSENVILSNELVEDKKRLNETEVAIKLNGELQRLITDQKEAARLLEMESRAEQDPVVVAELATRKNEIENKIGGVVGQIQQLKIPLGRKIKAFFTGREARNPGIQYAQLYLCTSPI
ncbi:hypothetical protein FIBSPDRAFT_764093 [Athelia psychrophila]|uniref:G domain-containing protein n=1 Tax=Athelia psychrophila TaxID=1759441 RepID=A0A167WYD5_9AGAM|nr:hypothetical protein FIBSPDRAFT_764093 [Fibularhizoctonia sp. CBS 109695]